MIKFLMMIVFYEVKFRVIRDFVLLASRGRLSSRGRRCGRLRSFPLASLRSNSHPSPLLTPLSRRLRLSSRGRRIPLSSPKHKSFQ
jgi:hypothetical protein